MAPWKKVASSMEPRAGQRYTVKPSRFVSKLNASAGGVSNMSTSTNSCICCAHETGDILDISLPKPSALARKLLRLPRASQYWHDRMQPPSRRLSNSDPIQRITIFRLLPAASINSCSAAVRRPHCTRSLATMPPKSTAKPLYTKKCAAFRYLYRSYFARRTASVSWLLRSIATTNARSCKSPCTPQHMEMIVSNHWNLLFK
mmetsp:Transcript_70449/g.158320  ORF Transcript_70449/g.158320 Transcript_70449/m.158320 type:complete len:202 (-) Transcript_70449:581-1186(-)